MVKAGEAYPANQLMVEGATAGLPPAERFPVFSAAQWFTFGTINPRQ
jgi:hypothetical protein